MDNFEGRPILQAILNDPSLQAILGDEAANLIGFHPSSMMNENNNNNNNNNDADGIFMTSTGGNNNRNLDQMAHEQNEALLEEISLRHRCSDLESENARLRSLLHQHSASTTELTRKLNLRDTVVDGLRKSVIQSQSQNARSLGQPVSLGFDVVEAMEEELSSAVSAQVRLRESSEAALKTKIDRQERGLRRIIAAKEREIIQLHLQFRQTLVQLRSQHSGDIQSVFEENTRLKRLAAEAEQNALIAAEVQFNSRLRAEQMRIESECEAKIGSKLVEMKYLRECLDTQEAAAKKLEDVIEDLNKKIEAKDRILHHVLDVELPYEINKYKKQLEDYITSDSAQGQIDLANAKIEIDDLKKELDSAKETVSGALRERNDASHSTGSLKNEIANKDAQIRDLHSRLGLLQQTVTALERDSDQTAMEMHLLRRMQVQQEDRMNSTLSSSTHANSPTSASIGADAELRRQVALYQDENQNLKTDVAKMFEQINQYRDDVKSASSSRSILQDRVTELEKALQEQIFEAQAALDRVQKQLQKEVENANKLKLNNNNSHNNNNIPSGGADAGRSLQRRGTRVNIVLPQDADNKHPSGLTPSNNNSSLQRNNSLRRNNSSGKLLGVSAAGGGVGERKGSFSSNNNNSNTTRPGSVNNNRPGSAASNISEIDSMASSTSNVVMGGNNQKPHQEPKSGGGDETKTKNNNFDGSDKITGPNRPTGERQQLLSSAQGGNNTNNNDDPFSNFGARWETSHAHFGSPSTDVAGTERRQLNFDNNNPENDENDHADNNNNNFGAGGDQNLAYKPRSKPDPEHFIELRNVGVQCSRLVPATSSASSLRPTSANSAGRAQNNNYNNSNNTPLQFGRDSTNTPVSPKNLGGDLSNFNLNNNNNNNNLMRAPSVLGVNRVDSLIQNNNNLQQQQQNSSPPSSHPPSAVTQTLNPFDLNSANQNNNNNNNNNPSNSGNLPNQSFDLKNSTNNNNNNNSQQQYQGTAGEGAAATTGDLRPYSSASSNFNKDNNNNNQQQQPSNLIGEVEILPDEELNQYGVPSAIEDRQINARLRLELALIKFEIQHLAPPRFLAQAKAMLNSWEPLEEIEVPLINDVVDQNDLFEDELAGRRQFHALMFPGNLRCARFPYRADPNAEPRDAFDKIQLSLYDDDNATKRSKDVKPIPAPFEFGGNGGNGYNVTRGDLDHLRREFIASALALSRSAEGAEILRVPISSLILMRPNSASHRMIPSHNHSQLVQFAPNTTVGAGFRIYQRSSQQQQQQSADSAPTSPSRNNNTNNSSRPSSGTVRQTWKAPEGYLNVDAVQIPSVSHFTTKPNVLQPHRPNGLYWSEAASGHTGEMMSKSGLSARPPSAANNNMRNGINVNLDVAAVIADTNHRFGQEITKNMEGVTDDAASAVTSSRKHSEFANVMKQRLDPQYNTNSNNGNGNAVTSLPSHVSSSTHNYQLQQQQQQQQAATARTSSATNRNSKIVVGGKNGRTIL